MIAAPRISLERFAAAVPCPVAAVQALCDRGLLRVVGGRLDLLYARRLLPLVRAQLMCQRAARRCSEPRRLLSLRNAARLVGCRMSFLNRLIDRGVLRSEKVKDRRLVEEAYLYRLLPLLRVRYLLERTRRRELHSLPVVAAIRNHSPKRRLAA